jgi:predicted ribosome quality control (RQC) complex YloA/Tae2 family protein
VLKATLLENNLERVEEALRSVNGLLARGMDWGDIDRLISHGRERGNPVAEIILETRFKEGRIILGLRDDEEEDSSAEETDDEASEDARPAQELIKIDVDLGLSAWANAREYFDRKKVAAEKVDFLVFSGNVGITDCAIFI